MATIMDMVTLTVIPMTTDMVIHMVMATITIILMVEVCEKDLRRILKA